MSPPLIMSLVQAGFAGIGIFGLWHGYALNKQLISKPEPVTELERDNRKEIRGSIRYYLIACFFFTAMSGLMEVFKVIAEPENTINVRISNFSDLKPTMKPQMIFKRAAVKLEDNGEASVEVKKNDYIFIEIGQLLKEMNATNAQLIFIQNQMKTNLAKEIGYDDPNT